ncbi:hypothetical protein BC008_19865 [Mastigocoleus testarum BC008]|uniref:Uncharacterized protein n=2 Tax=Mastigocoleus TaxID=996924 RepID=A0A0V7ZKC1_9CYAN|nr:hypothetical protein BC008_19865 [Mastigocoleus testarum BC008]
MNGEKRSQLHQAIISAYPTQSKLAMMVDFRLEESLATIAGEIDLNTVVFKLITWAKAQGKLEKLIEGAYNENPSNPELENFYRTVYRVKMLEKLEEERDINSRLYQELEKEKSKNRQLNRELEEERNRNQELHRKFEVKLHQNQQTESEIYELNRSLSNLLQARKWVEANQATLNIINTTLNYFSKKSPNESLNERDIYILPCYLLCQIDRMWQQHSNYCFGLAVQQSIWQEKRCTNLETLGYYLGWYDADTKKWRLLSDPAFRAKVCCNKRKYKGILPTLSSNLEVNAALMPHLIEKLEFCSCDLCFPKKTVENN